jgi:hypothetical protein
LALLGVSKLAQGPVAAVVMQLSLKYVKASLTYLALGGTLLFATMAHILPFNLTAFYFLQLYGFVAMMIFGLSYLFVPSFAHAFLHSLRLAKAQFWLMNIAVIGMTLAFSGLLPFSPNIEYVVISSVLALLIGLYMHVYNLWRTMQAWKGSPGEKLAQDSSTSKRL